MSKKKKTTVVHNPGYNDRWIRDRFSSNQDYFNKKYGELRHQDNRLRSDLEQKFGQLNTSRDRLSQKVDASNRKFAQALDDLARREVKLHDVKGLDEQLKSIMGQATTADDALRELMKTQYGDLQSQMGAQKDQFNKRMTSRLDDLRSTLSGQFDTSIGNLESRMGEQYSGLQSDISGLGALGVEERAKLKARLESGEQVSAEERQKLEDRLTADMATQYTELTSRLGSSESALANLESTFTDDISNVRTALGEGLSALTGKQVQLDKLGKEERARIENELKTSTTLSAEERRKLEARLTDDLSGVKEAFGDYRTQTQGQFRDVETQFKAYKDDLLREGQRTDAAISDVYKTREEGVAALNKAWGQQLQTQEGVLTDRIAASKAALDKRLTDISTTMNYRTLGDSALGIQSRRSKAFKSGATSAGTGQLARSSTTVNTLNIA